MDVTLLVPIVVFLHVAPQLASSAGNEALHPPTLSVHRQHPTYFEGERAELICSAPPNRTADGYRFFDQSGRQILKMAPNAYQKGRLAFIVQMDSNGNYTCDYWMGRKNMEVTSARSNIISLQVKEAPAAPSLSLEPPGLDAYSQEDTVSLICSVPPETKEVKEFQYYGERQVTSILTSSPIWVYNLSLKDPSHVGSWQCAYVLQHSGRCLVSKRSSLVLVNVVGVGWARMLAVGGSFFTINGLIFLVSHCFC